MDGRRKAWRGRGRRRLGRAVALAAVAMAMAPRAWGQVTYTWSAPEPVGYWDVASNWTPAGPPASGEAVSVILAGAADGLAEFRAASGTVSVGTLRTTMGLAVTGGSLTVSGATTVEPSGSVTASGGSLEPGVLTLDGTLLVSGAGATVTAGALFGAGRVELDGAAFTLGASVPSNSTTSEYLGEITGTGTVLVRHSNLLLRGTSGFSGALVVEAGGAIGVASDAALGAADATLVLDGGALYVLADAPPLTVGRSIELRAGNGALQGGEAELTVDGVIHGVGQLYVDSGKVRLRGANTYAGATYVAKDSLELAGPEGSVRSALLEVSGAAGAVLVLDDSAALGGRHAAGDRIRDDATVVLRGGSMEMRGAAEEASAETIGALRSEGAWSSLRLVPGGGGGGTVALTLGALEEPTSGLGFTLDVVAPDLGGASRLLLADEPADGTLMPGWLLANASALTKYAAGRGVVPMVREDFAVNAPTPGRALWLEPGAPAPATLGSLTVPALHLEASSGPVAVEVPRNATLTITGGGLVKRGAHDAALTGQGTLTVGQGLLNVAVEAGTLTIEPELTGAMELRKRGAGTLRLAGQRPNTFTGLTRVRGGTLELGKRPHADAVGGNVWVEDGVLRSLAHEQIPDVSWVRLWDSTWDLNGRTETIDTLYLRNGQVVGGQGLRAREIVNEPPPGSVPGMISVNLNTGTLILDGAGLNVDAGRVVTVGSGGIRITGASSPTLTLVGAAAGGEATRLVLEGGVDFAASAGTASIVAGPGAVRGHVDLAGDVRTLAVNDGAAPVDLLVSAELVNGGIRKAGAGTARLSDASGFAGGTVVSLGTLEAAHPSALGTGPVKFNGGRLKLLSDATGTTVWGPAGSGGAAAGLSVIASSAAASVRIAAGRLNEASAGPARFQVGPATLGPRLAYAGPLDVTLVVAGGVTLLADSAIENGGGGVEIVGEVRGPFALTKSGAGTLTLAGTSANTFSGATVVQEGTLVLAKPAGVAAVPGGLEVKGSGLVRWEASEQVADGATVVLNAALGGGTLDLAGFHETVGAVQFVAGGLVRTGPGGTLTTRALSASGSGVPTVSGKLRLDGAGTLGGRTMSVEDLDLTPAARLDLGAGGRLLIAATPDTWAAALAEAEGWAKDGMDGVGGVGADGAWASGGVTGIATVLNRRHDGTALHATFGGAPATAWSVLVMVTRHGDVNVDGRVDATDYHQIDRAWSLGLTGYAAGDLDYSGGRATVDDYLLIDRAFLAQHRATMAARAADAGATRAAVPEPGPLACAAAAAAAAGGLLARRAPAARRARSAGPLRGSITAR